MIIYQIVFTHYLLIRVADYQALYLRYNYPGHDITFYVISVLKSGIRYRHKNISNYEAAPPGLAQPKSSFVIVRCHQTSEA